MAQSDIKRTIADHKGALDHNGTTAPSKFASKQTPEELQKAIEEFKSKGNTSTVVPQGKSGKVKKLGYFKY